MSVLVIVSCGKSKIWDKFPNAGQTKAKNAYISGYFKWNRRYAEKFSDRWMILSAKYGFIEPDFIIPENYNVSFLHPSTNPISIAELRKQIKEKGLDRFDKIVVLGGSKYVDIVRKAFQGYDVEVVAPTLGLPLGKAMSLVKNAVLSSNSLH
jgi:hypothetical protein